MRHIILATFLLGISLKMYAPEANVDAPFSNNRLHNTHADQVIQMPTPEPVEQTPETEQEDTSNFSCLCHDIEDLHLNERQRTVVYRDSWRLKAYRFFAVYSVIYGVYSFALNREYRIDEFSLLLSFLGLAMLMFDFGMEGVKPLRNPQLSLC